MVFFISIIRPNRPDTSSTLKLGSFYRILVRNITSNFINLISFALFALFIFRWFSRSHVTTARRRSGQRLADGDSTNCRRPAAVDHAPRSASHHRSRLMVGSGGGWHSRRRPIKHRVRLAVVDSCRPFSRSLCVPCVAAAEKTKRPKKKDSYGKSRFFGKKSLRVKSLIKGEN